MSSAIRRALRHKAGHATRYLDHTSLLHHDPLPASGILSQASDHGKATHRTTPFRQTTNPTMTPPSVPASQPSSPWAQQHAAYQRRARVNRNQGQQRNHQQPASTRLPFAQSPNPSRLASTARPSHHDARALHPPPLTATPRQPSSTLIPTRRPHQQPNHPPPPTGPSEKPSAAPRKTVSGSVLQRSRDG